MKEVVLTISFYNDKPDGFDPIQIKSIIPCEYMDRAFIKQLHDDLEKKLVVILKAKGWLREIGAGDGKCNDYIV